MLSTAHRYALLHLLHKGLKFWQAIEEMDAVYGAKTVSVDTVKRWFKRFEAGDFSVEDKPRSGRPSTLDDERLRELVESEPRTTVRELSFLMGEPIGTVYRHLHKIGKVTPIS